VNMLVRKLGWGENLEEGQVTLKIDVISLSGVLKAGLHLISSGYVQVLGACEISHETLRLMKGREFHDWLCNYDCVQRVCVLYSWLTWVAVGSQKNLHVYTVHQ